MSFIMTQNQLITYMVISCGFGFIAAVMTGNPKLWLKKVLRPKYIPHLMIKRNGTIIADMVPATREFKVDGKTYHSKGTALTIFSLILGRGYVHHEDFCFNLDLSEETIRKQAETQAKELQEETTQLIPTGETTKDDKPLYHQLKAPIEACFKSLSAVEVSNFLMAAKDLQVQLINEEQRKQLKTLGLLILIGLIVNITILWRIWAMPEAFNNLIAVMQNYMGEVSQAFGVNP